jgi:hypothetical protein
MNVMMKSPERLDAVAERFFDSFIILDPDRVSDAVDEGQFEEEAESGYNPFEDSENDAQSSGFDSSSSRDERFRPSRTPPPRRTPPRRAREGFGAP